MEPSTHNALASPEFNFLVTIGLVALAALGWLSSFGLSGSSILSSESVWVTAPDVLLTVREDEVRRGRSE